MTGKQKHLTLPSVAAECLTFGNQTLFWKPDAILLRASRHGDLNPDQATNGQKMANIQAIEESN